MQNVFRPGANWLLIIPLFFAVTERLFNYAGTTDLHLHDTYFVIADFHIWIFFLLLNLVPFGCHAVLRQRGTKSNTFLLMHIVVALLCNVLLFVIFKTAATGLPRRYFDAAEWDANQQAGMADQLTAIFVLLLLLIHVLLVIYTLYTLLKKRKTG